MVRVGCPAVQTILSEDEQADGNGVSVPDQTPDETDLILAARQGDQDAFRELVFRYQRPVFAVAYGIVLSSHDAADVAQETFIRFHRHMALFDPSRPLRPFLTTIAANLARDILRKRARRGESSTEEDSTPLSLPDAAPDPSRQTVQSERCEAVRSLLFQLPETMRNVCVMFYLGNASCRQVAQVLGMSETAVKVNLHRARKRLLEMGVAAWRYA